MVICDYLMETKFVDWLLDELNKRSMSQADLARMSSITPAQISRIISGQRKPGEEALSSIARAFKLPPETVFRAAGLLPDEKPDNYLTVEANFLMSLLTPQQREEAIRYIRYLASQQEGNIESHATRVAKPKPSSS